MHGFNTFFILTVYIFYLLINDTGTFTAGSGKVKYQVIFKFMKVLRFDAQRIYNHFIILIKFHKVYTAKHGSVLILLATSKFQVFSFYLISIMRNIIIA